MRQHFPRLGGLRVAIVGDVLHSRVARSNVLALTTMGAEVTLVAPPTLLPARVDAWPVAVSYDLDAVLPKQDVVMLLRVQLERQQAGFFPSLREYARLYGLDAERLAAMAPHAIVMHPGPMNRGVEIAAEVADSLERSVIASQVSNGISVRMALLYLLLGGPPVPDPECRPSRVVEGHDAGSGLGNTSVPWPGRPLRPVGVGGFGEAERRKLADGERGQVLIQLRAGNGAGQHDRCPRLSQRGGQRDRVLGDAARSG